MNEDYKSDHDNEDLSRADTPQTSTHKSESVKQESHVAEYSFQQVREVWYKSLIDGATLWQYCQDTKKNLPQDFEKIADLLFNNTTDVAQLKTILDNSAFMCGLADEYLKNYKEASNSVADQTQKSIE